jgi:uncharacterized protein YraI
MKNRLWMCVVLGLAWIGWAEETVRVTGDRVSLRAEPDLDAVLLGRAMTGEVFALRDNANPSWVGVQSPAGVDVWVSAEFVSNSIVQPELLNIRSGPSLSHSVVGLAQQGETLTVRGEIAGWLRIAPTSNTLVWISRDYVQAPPPTGVVAAVVSAVSEKPPTAPQISIEVVSPPTPAPVAATSPPKPAPAASSSPAVQPPAVDPAVQEVMTTLSAGKQKKLVADPLKKQGTLATMTGVLTPDAGILYKLVDENFSDVDICYIRGNQTQMKVFSGKKLEISGRLYWAKGVAVPVLVPLRITPLPAKVW